MRIGYIKTGKKLYQTLHNAIFRDFAFDRHSIEQVIQKKMKWNCKILKTNRNTKEWLMGSVHD